MATRRRVARVAGELLLTYRVYRFRRHRRSVVGADVGDPVDTGTDVEDLVNPGADRVECPACGAENELGYRFCRDCVSKLPFSVRFDRSGADPLRRLTR